MEGLQELTSFYDRIKDDHRIGPVHISLYMAILHLYQLNGFANPVPVSRALLMELAKIRGLATYHKCIKELHEAGFIQYLPSHHARKPSLIFLLGARPLPENNK